MSIVSTRYGRMRIIDADEVVSRALALYGEWAMDELNLLSKLITPGMCVLDVGAFVGTHTLAFSVFTGQTGRVYSFEPRKEIYDILVENLSINDRKNVSALNIGLAEKEKTINLQSLDISKSINYGGLAIDLNDSILGINTYQVCISTIDALHIEKIDVIKLDVEGMERKVLDGAVRTIKRDRPIIFCECNSLSAGNEVLKYSQSIQYETCGFLASAYNPDNFNVNKKNIFGTAKELALLLIPQEQFDVLQQKAEGVNLLPINNLEDLILPLLHKPQYAYEVLAHTTTGALLGINFPSPAVTELEGNISNLHQGIAERDGQIANLNQGITERDVKVVNLKQGIADRDAQAINLYQGIADRDTQIINLYQGITDRDCQIITHIKDEVVRYGQITNLNQGIAERDSQIANLNQGIAERDSQITNLNQDIAERDSQITNLNQDIAERDSQIINLNQDFAERDSQIINLNQDIAERDSQIINLNQDIAERDSQITNLNQGIAERDGQITKIIHSKSWFITKPFRWGGRVCRGELNAAIDPFKRSVGLNEKTAITLKDDLRVKSNSNEFILTSAPIKPTHPTAVIVPVYRGIEMTKRCILAAMPCVVANPKAKLLAINDASPNEGMQEMLEQLAAQWPDRFLVLKNESNLGFVRTVNRGLAYFSQYDVVLLNSDVIVPKEWLSRLIDEAYSSANIGTVTPFSNNATICSFPYFLQENVQPFDLDVDSVDAVFRHEKLPCIEAPTGVGFCMYIRRSCLDKIGYLNEEKFGRGYGEENDLCQRALKSGWLNLISPNMYAFHEGGVSFSSDKQALVDRAMCVLDELHPNYHADVQKFIKNDPVRSVRVARYAQLLATIPIPKVLHISHSVGGGVKQHIDELAEYYDQRVANILLAPQGNDICISLGIHSHADKLIYSMPAGYADMLGLLKFIGVSAVHFHHTLGLDQTILQLANELEVARLLTVHDFYWLGANPSLTDETGKYPGFYSDQLHNPLYPLPHGMTVKMWQYPLRPFIEGADCVIFPSNSTKILFNNVYHPANSVVAPHVELHLNVNTHPVEFKKKDSYTIGVLGAIGREKGADLLEGIAVHAKATGLNFNFKLIGYAYRPLNLVEITGPYETKDLKDLIHRHELDIVFFTAQWPETYSYTLSHALDSGLPIVAPNVGAFPERLSGRPNTLLFNHLDTVAELLTLLTAFVERVSKKGAVIAPVFNNDKSQHDFYSLDYLSIVSRDLKIVEVSNLKRFGLNPSQIISGGLKSKNISWRESLVHILWRLHMNPSLRWISRTIPHGVRRAVRRSLSSSNSHDIASSSRGK